MAFELLPLPYARSALEPHMSAKTLEFHHGKHHRAYVTNLNSLVGTTPLAAKSLESIIRETAKDTSKAGIFNNAAQVWNHTCFWNSMKPAGGGAPVGDLASRIDRDFESFDKFQELFQQAAVGQFGSGWAWLVADKRDLKIVKTANAVTPIVQDKSPSCLRHLGTRLLSDYQNRRPDFVHAFLDHLVTGTSPQRTSRVRSSATPSLPYQIDPSHNPVSETSPTRGFKEDQMSEAQGLFSGPDFAKGIQLSKVAEGVMLSLIREEIRPEPLREEAIYAIGAHG